MAHRLITLAYSHYNEKARWALDLAGVPYSDHRYMPPFSMGAVAVASRLKGGNADKVSSRFSTPYLITEDGRHLADSALIARWASARGGLDLYGDPQVEALEKRFHDEIGPHTRRIAYLFADADARVLKTIAERNVSRRQALAFKVGYRLFNAVIKDRLKVDEDHAARSAEILEREVAAVEERLADGRRYLVGDRFTAADLTFACMLAPALLVTRDEGYSSTMPSLAEVPERARAATDRWRASAGGQFALRMFREHRRHV